MNQNELDRALVDAASKNLWEVDSLVARGARSSSEALEAGGRDALMTAISRGAEEQAKTIWLAGADAQAMDDKKRTAFWWAAKKNMEGMARLLAPFSDINHRDSSGATPLIICLANSDEEDGDLGCLDFLLEISDFDLSAQRAPSDDANVQCMGSMEIAARHFCPLAREKMMLAFAKNLAMREASELSGELPEALGHQPAKRLAL